MNWQTIADVLLLDLAIALIWDAVGFSRWLRNAAQRLLRRSVSLGVDNAEAVALAVTFVIIAARAEFTPVYIATAAAGAAVIAIIKRVWKKN